MSTTNATVLLFSATTPGAMPSTPDAALAQNRLPESLKTIATVLYTILFAVGVSGNSMVVYIFGIKKKTNRTTNELLLLSLGICDLITSFVLPPIIVYTSWTVGTKSWYVVSCIAIPVLLAITISTSQVILILICYDRYRAIVKPLEHKRCTIWIRYSIVIAFVIGVVLSIPKLTELDMDKYKREICLDYKDRSYQTLIQYLILILRDLVTLGVMSYFIYQILRALAARQSFLALNTSTKEGQSFQRTRRILYAVIIVFFLLIVPGDIFFFANSIRYYGKGLTSSQFYNLTFGLVLMKFIQICNSSANVFIYSAIHPEFKKLYRKIFSKRLPLAKCERRGEKEVTSTTPTTRREIGVDNVEMAINAE